ncbi:MAG: hypothetical protein ACYS22_10465 [Planctomycetota bacterium]|jgi:hypothetical protein
MNQPKPASIRVAPSSSAAPGPDEKPRPIDPPAPAAVQTPKGYTLYL